MPWGGQAIRNIAGRALLELMCVCVSPRAPGKIKKRTLHTGGRVDVHCRPTSPLLSPPPRLQFAQRGRQQQQQPQITPHSYRLRPGLCSALFAHFMFP